MTPITRYPLLSYSLSIFILVALPACGTDEPAALVDAGAVDSGAGDLGVHDSGTLDAATNDSGVIDAGPVDANLDMDLPPYALGHACSSAEQCTSSFCADGFCCNSACDGTCESCAASLTGGSDGACAATTAATDPDDECADAPCATGLCSGTSGVCGLREAESVCRAAAGPCDFQELCTGVTSTCPDDVFVHPLETHGACDGYICTGSSASCPSSCDTQDDCALGSVCVSSACVPGKRVFVTSGSWSGNLGGAGGADSRCESIAAGAGLTGTFRAWLGDSTTSPAARLTHATIPYYRMDGTVPRIIAYNWADFVDGVSVAIAEDEYGNPQANVAVWTGANDDGTAHSAHCNNWSSDSSMVSGMRGNASAAAFSTYFSTGACSEFAHLYCFEQ